MIYVYLLIHSSRKRISYIGYTTNLKKRLRQHQGYLKGGAKYTTSAKPCKEWYIAAYFEGFETKRQAMSFEWHAKRQRRYHKNHKDLIEKFKTTQCLHKFKHLKQISFVLLISHNDNHCYKGSKNPYISRNNDNRFLVHDSKN